jgi:hypothetical protein
MKCDTDVCNIYAKKIRETVRGQMKSMAFLHAHIYIHIREKDIMIDIKSALPFLGCDLVLYIYILYAYIGIEREERKDGYYNKINERDDTSYLYCWVKRSITM